MKIFDRVEDLIGKTPLLEIKNFNKQLGLNAKILAKLEYFPEYLRKVVYIIPIYHLCRPN